MPADLDMLLSLGYAPTSASKPRHAYIPAYAHLAISVTMQHHEGPSDVKHRLQFRYLARPATP